MALAVVALLFLPVWAGSRMPGSMGWKVPAGISLAASLLSYFALRADKRRAESGHWRIPESTLHLAELMGGWPGSLVGQRRFRHKTSKVPYQALFWGIVALHQYLALDMILGWTLTRGLVDTFGIPGG